MKLFVTAWLEIRQKDGHPLVEGHAAMIVLFKDKGAAHYPDVFKHDLDDWLDFLYFLQYV